MALKRSQLDLSPGAGYRGPTANLLTCAGPLNYSKRRACFLQSLIGSSAGPQLLQLPFQGVIGAIDLTHAIPLATKQPKNGIGKRSSGCL